MQCSRSQVLTVIENFTMTSDVISKPITKNEKLLSWVREMTRLCQPQSVHWCTGSKKETQDLCEQMVRNGTFTKLNPGNAPAAFLARSHPSDVARVEDRTFICTPSKEDAGPTNHWADPVEMKKTMLERFKGSMKGRTMYVIPFAMGPLESPCKSGSRSPIRLTWSSTWAS